MKTLTLTLVTAALGARRDGAVGERPAARRRPRPAPERHTDREAGRVSRVRCALRPGIRLDVRPLRPLLVPALRLSRQTDNNQTRGRPWAASLFMAKRVNSPACR